MDPVTPADAVPVVDAHGTLHFAAPSDVSGLQSIGFTLATPEQLAAHQAQQEQAGAGGALKAAAQSAADTATFGTASWAETALGLRSPEDILAGEKAHPISSGLGTLGGALAPLGAEGLLERAGFEGLAHVAGGAPGVIAKVGEGTTDAARAALGTPTTRLGRIAADTIARGAGSAIEGAAYGLGQSVSEDALDPDLTVESAFSRGATDALLNGALGGVIGTPLGLVSSALKEVPAGAELADRLEAFAGERRLKAAGAIQSDITRAAKKISPNIEIGRADLIRQANEATKIETPDGKPMLGRFTSEEELNSRAHAVLEDTGQQMQEVGQQVDEIGRTKPSVLPDLQQVVDEFRTRNVDPLETNYFRGSALNKLENFVDLMQEDIDGNMAGNGRVSFQRLWQIRRDVSEAIYGWRSSKVPGSDIVTRNLRDLRGQLSAHLDASVQRAGLDSSEWRRLSRTYQVASTMENFSGRGLVRGNGNNVLSLTEIGALGAGFLHGGPLGVAAPVAFIAARRYGSAALAEAADALATRLRGAGDVGGVVPGGGLPGGAPTPEPGTPPITHAANAVEKAVATGPAPAAPPAAAAGVIPHTAPMIRGTIPEEYYRAATGAFQRAKEIERGAAPFDTPMGKLTAQQWRERGNALREEGDRLVQSGTNMPEKVAALAALERVQREALNEAHDVGRGALERRSTTSTPAPASADILDTVARVNRLANAPDQTAQLVQRLTDETHEHAPGMTAKAGEVAGRVVNYLQQNAPQASKPYPLGPELKPDRAALVAFHEKAQAVRAPLETLRRNPSKAVVAAIEAVYPALMQEIRSATISALAEATSRHVFLSQQQRTAASNILGADLDGSQSPQLTALSQGTYAALNRPPMAPRAPGPFKQSVKTKSYAEMAAPLGGRSLRTN